MKPISKYLRNSQLLLHSFRVMLGIFVCLTFFGCEQMLSAPQVAPYSDNIGSAKAIATPRNVTASHGQKRQITISWSPVNNASLYYIYKADSPHSEFTQIDEAAGSASSITVKVPSGYSGYFKIAAVNSQNEASDMSLITYGTSLATPVITAINESESTSTVFWYMENLSEKSYLNSVQYVVTCYNADGSTKATKILKNTDQTYCSFENLFSGTTYSYDVETYLSSDQTTTEKSLKLTRSTLASTIPPVADFTVSEGTSASEITLKITLPPMAKVIADKGTGGSDATSYKDKPVFFKIERFNDSTGSYELVEDYLGFDGSTDDSRFSTDAANPFAGYKAGDIVTWTDKNVDRGVKYAYRVISYTDDYFNNGARIQVFHDYKNANVNYGWTAAIPAISSSEVTYSTDELPEGSDPTAENKKYKYKTSASTTISAAWNSLGKDDDYVFMLMQNYKKFKTDNNNVIDDTGVNSFVKHNGSCYYDTLSDLTAVPLTYNFTSPLFDGTTVTDADNTAVRGYYRYTLCIISKSVAQANPDPDFESIKDSLLTYIADPSTKLVTDGETINNVKIVISDGYADKTVLTIPNQSGIKYKYVRQALDSSGLIDMTIDAVTSSEITGDGTSETKTVEDTNLISGKAYQYTLYASNSVFDDVPSNTEKAYTLGTPAVVFDSSAADYSTVTVKWNSAVHPAEAQEVSGSSRGASSRTPHNVVYNISYNNKVYSFKQNDFNNFDDSNPTVKIDDENGVWSISATRGKDFTLILKKDLTGFIDAKTIKAADAGKSSPLTLITTNEIDNNSTASDPINVYTLGPALTATKASTANYTNKIDITWNKLKDIKYYAVKRTCKASILNEGRNIDDIFYISVDDKSILYNGESVGSNRYKFYEEDSNYRITDLDCNYNDDTNNYQVNQSKIAFGIPYEYTITPVKSMDDNPFRENFAVSYSDQNAVSSTGFTKGYGLNVNASKADHSDKIHITWDKPNSSTSTVPYLWCKDLDSASPSWQCLGKLTSNATSTDYTLEETKRCDRVEFAVSYDSAQRESWTESFINYLTSEIDTNSNEQKNMGYEFTLSNMESIVEKESFDEVINWTLWDESDPRKNGPEGYTVYVKNLNCSDKWFKLADISKSGVISLVDLTNADTKWYDIDLKKNGDGLKLTALNNGSPFTTTQRLTRGNTKAAAITGEHNGLLKVQRDYKHYYKIVGKRTSSTGEEVKTSLGAFDETSSDTGSIKPIYSYRKISDDEFVKGITLLTADACYKTGVNESANGESLVDSVCSNGIEGKFGLYHQSGTKTFAWGTRNTKYKHQFAGTPASSDTPLTSGWSIQIDDVKEYAAADSHSVYHFPWSKITASHETGWASYSGSILLSAGEMGSHSFICITDSVKLSWKLTLQYSHQTNPSNDSDKLIITAAHNDSSYNSKHDNCYTVDSNETEFYKWFPYSLSANNEGYSSIDTNLPVNSGSWWVVR